MRKINMIVLVFGSGIKVCIRRLANWCLRGFWEKKIIGMGLLWGIRDMGMICFRGSIG